MCAVISRQVVLSSVAREKCVSLSRDDLVLIVSFMNLCIVVFVCVQNIDYLLIRGHRSAQAPSAAFFFSLSYLICKQNINFTWITVYGSCVLNLINNTYYGHCNIYPHRCDVCIVSFLHKPFLETPMLDHLLFMVLLSLDVVTLSKVWPSSSPLFLEVSMSLILFILKGNYILTLGCAAW